MIQINILEEIQKAENEFIEKFGEPPDILEIGITEYKELEKIAKKEIQRNVKGITKIFGMSVRIIPYKTKFTLGKFFNKNNWEG